MTPAARRTPDHPNSPTVPVPSGTNGVRFSIWISGRPKRITRITMPTLSSTMSPFTVADALMPTMRRVVRNAMIPTAGRLTSAPVITKAPSL
jgi:hypothetical protein